MNVFGGFEESLDLLVIIELHLGLLRLWRDCSGTRVSADKPKLYGVVHRNSQGFVGDGDGVMTQTFFLQEIIEALDSLGSQIHQVYISYIRVDALFHCPAVSKI